MGRGDGKGGRRGKWVGRELCLVGTVSSGSHPKWPQWLELGQAEVRSQELCVCYISDGAQAFGSFPPCFLRHTSTELDWKWSS